MKKTLNEKIEHHYFNEYFTKALGAKKIHRLLKIGIPQVFGLAGWVLGGMAFAHGAPILWAAAVACKLLNLPLTGFFLLKARTTAKTDLHWDIANTSLLTRYNDEVAQPALNTINHTMSTIQKHLAVPTDTIDEPLRKTIRLHFEKEYYETARKKQNGFFGVVEKVKDVFMKTMKRQSLSLGLITFGHASLVGAAMLYPPLGALLFGETVAIATFCLGVGSTFSVWASHRASAKRATRAMDHDIDTGVLLKRYKDEVLIPQRHDLMLNIDEISSQAANNAIPGQIMTSPLAQSNIITPTFGASCARPIAQNEKHVMCPPQTAPERLIRRYAQP